jgi:hypothetical protein
MRKGAERQGGQPPSGTRATGYGWLRPGFLTMPLPANDNRMAPRSLLRRPQTWLWLVIVAVGLAWIATRF